MEDDPETALHYATVAEELGDCEAASIRAEILDRSLSTGSGHMTTARARLVSQLLAKLDPSFAYHAGVSEKIKGSGFIQFISGLNYSMSIMHSKVN